MKRILLCLGALLSFLPSAWAGGGNGYTYYANLVTHASGTGMGKVYSCTASQKPKASDYATSSTATASKNGNANASSADITFYAYAQPSDGYEWSHWSKEENGSSVSTDNPYAVTVTATSTDKNTPTEETLYAVFKPLQPIGKPTAATGLVYDGTVQTGVAAGEHYTLGGTYQAKDAGSYTATVTPASGYCWPDKSSGALTLAWSIARRPVTVSALPAGKTVGEEDPVYETRAEGFVDGDSTEAEVSWKVWRTNLVEQGDGSLGLGEAVGAYDLVVSGTGQTANYAISYVNGQGAFVIRPKPAEIAVPTGVQGLVYDGTVQTGVVAGEGIALAGEVRARNAGSHVVTATPLDGYCWEGGSTEARTVSWFVSRLPITVTPVAGQKMTVGCDYAIAFATDVEPVGTDHFTGSLAADEETVGRHWIVLGSLEIDDGNEGANYQLTFVDDVTIEVEPEPPSMPADDGRIDYDPTTKEVVVKPDAGVKEVEIVNMPDDATAQVPVSVDTVKGVTSNQVVVVAEATNATGTVKVDITDAFRIVGTPAGVTIELNEDPSAEVEVEIAGVKETIRVTPELTEAGDAVAEPLTVSDGEVGLGAKTIPGLTYVLKRLAELGGAAETVASEKAKGTRTKLTDPMKGEKPNQAFYVIEVKK